MKSKSKKPPNAKIQQTEIPPQSRPRKGNRTIRQAGQYAAVTGAQVEEGL